jgi:hypothetical protein
MKNKTHYRRKQNAASLEVHSEKIPCICTDKPEKREWNWERKLSRNARGEGNRKIKLTCLTLM